MTEPNHAKIRERLKQANECLELLMSQDGIKGDGFRQRVRECITLNNLALK